MRFLAPRGRRGFVSVRDLAGFMHCPRFFLLQKLFSRRTEAMRRGAEIHRRAYEVHREGAINISLEEAVVLSSEERMVGREIWLSDGRVHGIVDYVEIEDGIIRTVEYKSTERSAKSPLSRYQALIYGVLALNYSDRVLTEVRTFEGEVYHRIKVEERHRRRVEKVLEGFRRSVAEGVFPGRKESCRLCPLRNVCGRTLQPLKDGWESIY